ncbi:MAG: YeeE/YedE family protein [Bacteriovoracaceae bacterium]|nr:YeeE/YedE family protein [Bacteriovoracaceae bacterium]
MENFTPWQSLFGGALIGLSSALLYLGQGRIAGISGIFGGMLSKFCRDFAWRYFFVAGLIVGGLIVYLMMPEKTAVNFTHPLPLFAIGGLLVGVGTRIGNGCTSGHGICGLGRRSPRSLAAVMTFMAAGGVTVFIMGRFL